MSRRLVAAMSAAALMTALSACSTGSASSDTQPSNPAGTAAAQPESSASASASADPPGKNSAARGPFPVKIHHAFGTTTIKEQPQRVATISWVNADIAIALGVVPVGMPLDDFGANKHHSTPWRDAALKKLGAPYGSDAYPTQYSETDGVNYDAIAKLTPDVILAAYSGLDQQSYDKLSKIAPVVAYPKVPYGTPWQKATRMIGKALGKSQQAKQLVQNTKKLIEDTAAKYPALAGKTFIYANLTPSSGSGLNIYTPQDNRPKFLSMLGMKLAPVVTKHAKDTDKFYIPWSKERANELTSDVFVAWAPPKSMSRQSVASDPLLGQIPAVKSGAFVLQQDPTLTLAISASSPLSIPWAIDTFVPKLAKAAQKAD